ncbi:LysR family transcriptional regulator [Actinoplanes sp. ATCC 53533]|uniref:LysR family transcriptional regulator n=1 Tax=Actinoplanes sp. ATCC 53533 TaxID=1288362 RepID=UPI000F7B8BE8|nr:LysR family transcriptional regulator [Actinoplanes sp. ATCC 53533]RSM58155.1 LysR family transcriptional regulator [Actinoplanes sp. ATCC 53533]
MLDLHRLRVFRAVVASGSVNAAAANLGYTSSAVSQQVTALQRETGLVLLARSGRGIEPTSIGLALAEQIDGALSRFGDVEAFVADLRNGRTGSLSMAYFPSVGAAWLPAVARALLRRYPDVRLDLELRDDFTAGSAKRAAFSPVKGGDGVVGRGVDIQLLVAPPDFAGTRDTRAHHLLDDPYVVVVPPEHPLAGADAVELARLAGERWIDNDFARGWCRENLIDACRAAGFSPPFRIEAHDYPTALAFVEAGIGITVLPRLGTASLPGGLVAVPVTAPAVCRSIYAVVQTSVEATPPAQCVLEELRRCARAATA